MGAQGVRPYGNARAPESARSAVAPRGQRLGLGKTRIDGATKIVVAAIHGRLTGLVLDRVVGVSIFDSAALEVPAGAMASAVCVSHIGTVGDDLVQILDLEQLLSPTELELAASLGAHPTDDVSRAGFIEEEAR